MLVSLWSEPWFSTAHLMLLPEKIKDVIEDRDFDATGLSTDLP